MGYSQPLLGGAKAPSSSGRLSFAALALGVAAVTLVVVGSSSSSQQAVELLRSESLAGAENQWKRWEAAAEQDLKQLPTSNGKLKGAGVNTGEEHNSWDDKTVQHKLLSPTDGPTSNGKLKDNGVNTGEQYSKWMDDETEWDSEMPKGLIEDGADDLKTHIEPKEAKVEKPEHNKLDKLGVNTGEMHMMHNDDTLARPDQIKAHPLYTGHPRAHQYVATKGGIQQLRLKAGDPRAFFQQALNPIINPQAKAAKVRELRAKTQADIAASSLLAQVQKTESKAKAAAQHYSREQRQALRAEQTARKAVAQAEAVGKAKISRQRANAEVKAAEAKFNAALKKASSQIPGFGSKLAMKKNLDAEVAKDRAENKAMSSKQDVNAVMHSLNQHQEQVAKAQKRRIQGLALSKQGICGFTMWGVKMQLCPFE